MRKSECRTYMEAWAPFEWHWSSCRTCPYHSDRQWVELRAHSPEDFEAACVNDAGLRILGNVCNHLDSQTFVHRSCKPLREVDFDKQPDLFDVICDGGCHT